MISVEHLTFRYPNANAETLLGLDFEISQGEIFGFLGPSGAGKSTTQKILIGLLKGYAGSVKVMGREVSEWGQAYFEEVGVSFELPNHYLKLTALENLRYFRSLYSGETADPMDVLEWVGLEEDANKKVADFSKGMKIRLNVARSLIHKPKMLFLDEPTSGLDPVNARKIKDLILRIRDEGTTVFVTTHDMNVADQLCDRVAFITAGKISAIDAPSALKKAYGTRAVRVGYYNSPAAMGKGEILYQDFPVEGLGYNDAFTSLLKRANPIETVHSLETTLENIFIEITGEELTA